jgi:tRNA pseudouridine38-40 synthase
MTRYFFQIAYKGTHYFGWQRQPKQISVQEVLENELERVFREPIPIVGCGRTDAGVHAADYYFHCDLPSSFPLDKLLFKLNRMLPEDVVVYAIHPVKPEAHARFDALERTYHYKIHTFKHPFVKELSTYIPQKIDIGQMNHAAQLLLGKQDFTSFSKLHTDVKTNDCTVSQAQWIQVDQNQWQFEITANRFLRNMVRAIVGTLLDVGTHKIEPADLARIIAEKDRGKAGKSVPAQGLYLAKITYPFSTFVTEI